jgi:hypothetical protein
VWPDPTIAVVAALVGIRLVLRACATIAFGLGLRQLSAMTARVQT